MEQHPFVLFLIGFSKEKQLRKKKPAYFLIAYHVQPSCEARIVSQPDDNKIISFPLALGLLSMITTPKISHTHTYATTYP